jgi:hypothetical protein
MNFRISVNLARRRLQNLAFQPLGETKHVDRANHRGLGRLDWVVLVVNRGRGAGEIVDFIDFHVERKGDVVAHEFKSRLAVEMVEILFGSGEEIVHAQHLVAVPEEPIDEV